MFHACLHCTVVQPPRFVTKGTKGVGAADKAVIANMNMQSKIRIFGDILANNSVPEILRGYAMIPYGVDGYQFIPTN